MNLLPIFLKLEGRQLPAGGRGKCCAGKDWQPAADRG